MIYVGIDWSEEHHDVAVIGDGDLGVVRQLRIRDTLDGVNLLRAVLAEFAEDPAEVVIGVETVHNLVVRTLLAEGYGVYEINPLAASRYRDRHHLSGAKSDRADAKLLADLVRTDRHNHRPFRASTASSDAIKLLARSHENLIRARQDHLNELRSMIRQFYPAILAAFPNLCAPSDRDYRDAVAVLQYAPTPAQGRALTRLRIRRLLQSAGRQRNLDKRSAAIWEALHGDNLSAPDSITAAYGITVRALANLLVAVTSQIDALEREVVLHFERHPDAEIYRSFRGLGAVLGARALGEFGDDPQRFADSRARKNYATTSPVTRASGKLRVVSLRHGGNRRLGQTCLRWAYSSLTASPGARCYYDQLRARNKTHSQAIRTVANRLVGILHGCLSKGEVYSEAIAFPHGNLTKEAA